MDDAPMIKLTYSDQKGFVMRVAFAAVILFGLFSLFSVRAAVVTDCNEASLRGAVEQGGTVTFACDGVITLSNAIQITADVARNPERSFYRVAAPSL
jgi:hypothetical protein